MRPLAIGVRSGTSGLNVPFSGAAGSAPFHFTGGRPTLGREDAGYFVPDCSALDVNTGWFISPVRSVPAPKGIFSFVMACVGVIGGMVRKLRAERNGFIEAA